MSALPRAVADLPVAEVVGALAGALDARGAAVLVAPPGSGKTTAVPLALLDVPWLDGRSIVVLEPRRIAARAAAARMAALLGEPVGERVGHRVRFHTRVSPRTRVEVVTEGVLTRRLQRDPALEGVGLVVLDEFHERSLEADLALALVLDARRGLREDLRVLVMSATLDAGAVSAVLGGAPVLTCAGRQHPVEVEHLDREPDGPPGVGAARAVERVLARHGGDVLVFLPGGREIRTLAERLEGVDALVRPLYGDLPPEAQDRAIAPDAQGRRRVVLATNIAETSLTIEGVGVVVDSGLERRPRFDPASGLTRLETGRISQASAEQRAGRAGRLGPGHCLRLWTRATHGSLRAATPAEILSADLAPLALEVARWGVTDPTALDWLDAPPAGAWAQAVDLLRALGALDERGAATRLGRVMAEIPAHPRLARMLLAVPAGAVRARAAAIAALLEEGDPLRGAGAGADLEARLRLLEAEPAGRGRGAVARIRRAARALERALDRVLERAPEAAPASGALGHDPGALLALAYPDRVARQQGARHRYVLASGRAATLREDDALAGVPWLVAAALDAGREQGTVHLAAALDGGVLEAVLGASMIEAERVEWDEREEVVRAERRRTLGALVVERSPLAAPDPAALRAAMVVGVRRMGLEALPWTDAVERWRARVGSLRHWRPGDGWPDLGDEALTATLEEWLEPYLDGVTRRAHLARLDLAAILAARLGWPLAGRLDEGAPERIAVPSGSRVRLDYSAGEPPVLAVKLQELFGLTATPRVCWGEVPVTLHLLSPARRPVQVTSDLASFWERGYPEVRKELKGRYPKHPWPEDPRTATPTARTARRR